MSRVSKNKIIKACHKSIWSKDYLPSKYEFECALSQDIINSTPPKILKVSKNVTRSVSSSINESPKIRKPQPGI